jgi:glycosyltransferase involved in cell wall biosynthesis
VQAAVVLTERDRRALLPLAGDTALAHIPLGVTLPEHALNPLGEPPASVLFVGNYAHPPNVDAALRLVREIVPRVRAHVPSLTVNIVGDHPTREMERLVNAHVQVTGRVPDVTPYLDRASLVVVPLRLGGGMRVKVLEALAAGKAVVASPLAVAGLEGLVDGEHALIAETDEEFAGAIVRLLADAERRAALAAQARAWACAHLAWERVIDAYDALYERLAVERATQR